MNKRRPEKRPKAKKRPKPKVSPWKKKILNAAPDWNLSEVCRFLLEEATKAGLTKLPKNANTMRMMLNRGSSTFLMSEWTAFFNKILGQIPEHPPRIIMEERVEVNLATIQALEDQIRSSRGDEYGENGAFRVYRLLVDEDRSDVWRVSLSQWRNGDRDAFRNPAKFVVPTADLKQVSEAIWTIWGEDNNATL